MRALIQLELRSLLSARSLWVLLFLTGPLTGYSFVQALSLYDVASRSALATPQLASALNPFDGVIIPTYGSIYLALTLLFPFVAIRAISADRESGALRLLLQTPLRPGELLVTKIIVLSFALILAEFPGLVALAFWRWLGGHLYGPETLCLLFGHLLYGLLIISISFFVATVSDTASTAALLTLGCTLGSWVLDFAAGGNSWLAKLSGLSLTAALKPFEQGLLPWNVVLGIVITVGGLSALTLAWWHPGRPLFLKLSRSAGIFVVCLVLYLLTGFLRKSFDLTEDQRHSFAPEVSSTLRRIREPLRVTVYLAPEDPRLMDFDHSVLMKLRRALPETKIVNPERTQSALFKTGEDPNYGVVVYELGSRRAESRSTSPEEVLPLLWSLGGVVPPASEGQVAYSGYPLVVKSAGGVEVFFYLLWPACSLVGWLLFSGR